MEGKVHNPEESPAEIIVKMVASALRDKEIRKSYGTTTLEITWKDGWPDQLRVAEETTHKFKRP